MTSRLRVISSMATRQVLADACDAWHRQAGDGVALESVGGVDAARRVRDGEAFDVVVLAADAIDALAADGLLVDASKVDLVRSEVAIAVRAGTARPAIATVDELRGAVRSARRIGYSTGPSGIALLETFERWGLADAVRERLVQAPPGVPVARLLADGDVELGFQQKSELAGVAGIDLVGGMPPGAEIVTIFSGAVAATSRDLDAARAWLDFLRSPPVGALARRHGLEPI